MSEDLLQPGVQIKPHMTDTDVHSILKSKYGIAIKSMKELKSYDDKNYYIEVSNAEAWPHGYILKVTNSLDSKKLPFIEAQTELAVYLGKHHIKCPQPVKNINGQYYSVEKLPTEGGNAVRTEHVVRMLTFQPGITLHDVSHTSDLFYKCGRYIANLDNILKEFKHPAYDHHYHIWMMHNVPFLRKFLFTVTEVHKKLVVEEVIKQFEEVVLSKCEGFEKGLIHGDFNEHNILCSSDSDGLEWNVTGVIDFGDTHLSCYLFEIAITLCYMMLQYKNIDPIDIGGHVLAGYLTAREIPDEEYKLLKTCICARLCQSLVLGTYSHQLDPENEYLLDAMAEKWTLLFLLWGTPESEIHKKWDNIITSYENKIKEVWSGTTVL